MQAGARPVDHAPAVRAPDGTLTVACRICKATLDLTSRSEQHVVKCHECHEATVRQPSAVFGSYGVFSFALHVRSLPCGKRLYFCIIVVKRLYCWTFKPFWVSLK